MQSLTAAQAHDLVDGDDEAEEGRVLRGLESVVPCAFSSQSDLYIAARTRDSQGVLPVRPPMT